MRRSDLVLEPTLRRVFSALEGEPHRPYASQMQGLQRQAPPQFHVQHRSPRGGDRRSPSRSPPPIRPAGRPTSRATSPLKSQHRCGSPSKAQQQRAASPVRMWAPSRPSSLEVDDGSWLPYDQKWRGACFATCATEVSPQTVLAPLGPGRSPVAPTVKGTYTATPPGVELSAADASLATPHSGVRERVAELMPSLERAAPSPLHPAAVEVEEEDAPRSPIPTSVRSVRSGVRTVGRPGQQTLLRPSNGWAVEKAYSAVGSRPSADDTARSLPSEVIRNASQRPQTVGALQPSTAWGASIPRTRPSPSPSEPRLPGHASWAAARNTVPGKSGAELARMLDASLPPLHLASNLSGGEGKRRLREFLAKNMSRAQTLFAKIDIDGTGDIDKKEMIKLVWSFALNSQEPMPTA